MTTKEIAAAVAADTDKLRPGPGVTEADFHAVRSALADSLKGGQTPHEVIGLPAQPQEPIAEITGVAKGRKSKTKPVRIARRDKPLSVLSRPDWAAGAAPAQTIGPFLDENSGPVWFDVFQLVPQPVQVFRGGVAAFILPSGSKPNSEGISLVLPAGSGGFLPIS